MYYQIREVSYIDQGLHSDAIGALRIFFCRLTIALLLGVGIAREQVIHWQHPEHKDRES